MKGNTLIEQKIQTLIDNNSKYANLEYCIINM